MPNPADYSPLLDPSWGYIEKISQEDFTAADWVRMDQQRYEYYAKRQTTEVLRMLTAAVDDPSFGYMVNNYRHSLQSATMVMRDGHDEETIVVALLHDIGFTACPASHGEFAAALLRPYVDEKHTWMLERHAVFQDIHAPHRPGVVMHGRDRWRGHAHFQWAAEFVAKYDQDAVDPNYNCAPIEVFEPMVRRILARPPKRTPPL
jgi:predicted HD phosphohydrolase